MAAKRNLVDLDPDYEHEAVSDQQAKRQRVLEQDAKRASIKKIESIVRAQFRVEIENKEAELNMADQRLHQARSMMDRLRAVVIASYYCKLQQVPGKVQNTSVPLPPSIHPTVKKHIGKAPVSRAPPSAAAHSSATDTTRDSLAERAGRVAEARASGHVPPLTETFSRTSSRQSAGENMKTASSGLADSGTRGSRFTTKKQIVIGNVSKFIPPGQRELNDQSTHKWMVYVRGPRDKPRIDSFISKVWFFLHPSYRPNDLVEVSCPPFHLTRRGWGEFPVRVQLHFCDHRNKRVDVIHQLRLDQTCTGLQTLGAETVVEVELQKDLTPAGSRTQSPLPAPSLPLTVEAVVKQEPGRSDSSTGLCTCRRQDGKCLCARPGHALPVSLMETNSERHDSHASQTKAVTVTVKEEPPDDYPVSVETGRLDSVSSECRRETCQQKFNVNGNDNFFDAGNSSVPEDADTAAVKSMNRNSPKQQTLLTSNCESNNECNQSANRDLRSVGSEGVASPDICNSVNVSGIESDVSLTSRHPDGTQTNTQGSSLGQSVTPPTCTVTRGDTAGQLFIQKSSAAQSLLSLSQGAGITILPPVGTGVTRPVSQGTHIGQSDNQQTGISPSVTSGTLLKPSAKSSLARPAVSQVLVTPGKRMVSLLPGNNSLKRLMSQPQTPSRAGSPAITLSSGVVASSNIADVKSCTVTPGSGFSANESRVGASVSPGPGMTGSSASSESTSVVSARSVFLKVTPQGLRAVPVDAATPTCPILTSQPHTALGQVPCSSSTALQNVAGIVKPHVIYAPGRAPAPGMVSLLRKPVVTVSTSSPSSTPHRVMPGKSGTVNAGPRIVSLLGKMSGSLPSQVKLSDISLGHGNVLSTPTGSSSANVITLQSSMALSVSQTLVKSQKPDGEILPSIVSPSSVSAAVQMVPQVEAGGRMRDSHQVDLPAGHSRATAANSVAAASQLQVSGYTSQQDGKKHVLLQSQRTQPQFNTVSMGMDLAKLKTAILMQKTARRKPRSLRWFSQGLSQSGTSGTSTPVGDPSDWVMTVSADRKVPENAGTDDGRLFERDKKIIVLKTKKMPLEDATLASIEVSGMSIDDHPDMRSLVRAAVLKHPLIDADAVKFISPYCAKSLEQWLSWMTGKQRASEWTRAASVRRYLQTQLPADGQFKGKEMWTTRRIMQWCRLHGLSPHGPGGHIVSADGDSLGNPREGPVSSSVFSSSTSPELLLSCFTSTEDGGSEDDDGSEEIDVDSVGHEEVRVKLKQELATGSGLGVEILPPSPEAVFVQDLLAAIGVRFQPEELAPGVAVAASEEMIFAAMLEFAGDIVQEAVAASYSKNKRTTVLTAEHVYQALRLFPLADFLTGKYCGVTEQCGSNDR